MSDTVLAQIAALKGKSTPELREHVARAVRPRGAGPRQALPRGPARLSGSGIALRRPLRPRPAQARRAGRSARAQGRAPARSRAPIAGTRLRREWKGVEHVVTVREHDFEYNGRPYRSLSAVARAIAGYEMERLVVLWPSSQWQGQMIAPPRKIRCAIYCRKSSEEGLDQAFNSLDAQREACLAYVGSQRHEGWIAA